MSKRQAMMKAGYKKSTAENPKGNLMEKRGTARIIDSMKAELVNADLVPMYMANKFKEWLNAQKTEKVVKNIDAQGVATYEQLKSPDYITQLAAFDKWKAIMGIEETDTKVRRKLTIEEFIKETG